MRLQQEAEHPGPDGEPETSCVDLVLACPTNGFDPPHTYVEVEFRGKTKSANIRKFLRLMAARPHSRGLFVVWAGVGPILKTEVTEYGGRVEIWDGPEVCRQVVAAGALPAVMELLDMF